MTDEEKRQQKAMLLLEYQEAESNVAHLREKVRRMKQPLATVLMWLEQSSTDSYPANAEDNRKRDASIRANLESYRKALNFDEHLAAMDELVRAQELLRQLAVRKTELGLK